MECKILKVTLQPLVENCIKHAFRGISYKGIINISGIRSADGDTVMITVSDNGVGFSENPLSIHFESIDSGYGIYNVQQRLKLEYGDSCGLFYEINETGGTTVTVKIKYIP